MEKAIIRQRIAVLRDNWPEKERIKMNKLIEKNVYGLKEFEKAKAVMLFVPFRSEVDTLPIIKTALKLKKRVILPRVEKTLAEKKLLAIEINDVKKDLKTGAYGILEPFKKAKEVTPEEIELVFVPGIAFDKKGSRIGYGGGYYVRFLKNIPLSKRIGIAYSFQLAGNIPSTKHDLKVAKVLTEKGVKLC
ncbi:MAG: 5-formyltetrahydrofolate cyclo-ligase [Elusimicrobia bacterium]|nr:5-formyltetrahydrofolate cyclo-ligase [Elusimicrobiota bacterium]